MAKSKRVIIKNKTSKKRLLATASISALLLSLVATASINTVQAELIDLSTSKPVIKRTISNSNWLMKPEFRVERHCLPRLDKGDKLEVVLELLTDEKGRIIAVEVIKSSGDTCIDRTAMKQVIRGQLRPLTLNGEVVKSRAILPLKFVISS